MDPATLKRPAFLTCPRVTVLGPAQDRGPARKWARLIQFMRHIRSIAIDISPCFIDGLVEDGEAIKKRGLIRASEVLDNLLVHIT